ATFAATLKKGVHIQVEGPLHSREYEKDGVPCRVWELKAESILKLDRGERAQAAPSDEAPATEKPAGLPAEEAAPEERAAAGKPARRGSRRLVVPEEAPF